MGSSSATTKSSIPDQLAAATLMIICLSITQASSSLHNQTAYEILEDYNFPVGLLPKGVKDYDFNISTGKFSAYFNDTCNFSLPSAYQLKYQSTIKGYISNGKLSTLEGVYVRLFFMWVEIIEILRLGDDLVFSVGALSSVFPIEYFVESPRCGCGFQCAGRQLSKEASFFLLMNKN